MRKIAALLLLVILLSISCTSSGIREDEELVFFPTYGYITQKGMMALEIHGHIFEPETHSIIRNHLLEGLREILGLEKINKEYTFFENRSRLFMMDNERNKVISIRLGNSTHTLNKSGSNGHIITIIPFILYQA